jgi:prepilin-type N-terminal cleavage/methylation domain-containing protein
MLCALTVSTVGSGKRKRNCAFTLAEVTVAVAILGFLFAALFVGISFCFSLTKFERENLRATQIVLQRTEGIRLFNWNQLTNTALNPPTFTARFFPGVGSVPASGLTYSGTVAVAAVTLNPTATYSSNMQKITVTVKWTSDNNHQRTCSVTTYAARDGIQNYVWNN